MEDYGATIEQEIANVSMGRPHVVLLGAGASRAALPNGDKNGRQVPLLRDVADELNLTELFPNDLKELARSNFESAYSQLYDRKAAKILDKINKQVHKYFSELELPDEPNLYDIINLSLREKDAIFTFNWDPFLMQSRIRLAKAGVTTKFPKIFFLHGNATVGYCAKDRTTGINGRSCSRCGDVFKVSNLLFPVEHKDYQSDLFIKNEWDAAQEYLKNCFMFTIFGYSAPATDEEAIDLLKQGWGDVSVREMEQTEIINKPGSDHDSLRETWSPFIHTHHVDVVDNFYDSFLAKHPRRSIEAFWNQYFEAKFISNNSIPESFSSFVEMTNWFIPLFEIEEK